MSVTLDAVRTVVPALGAGSEEPAAQAVYGVSQPCLERLGRRGRRHLFATELHHLGDLFGHFGRFKGGWTRG